MPDPYVPVHADWKDYPDLTTPLTAAALEQIEAGLVEAISRAIVDAKGDLIVASAADTVARLAIGSQGQVLAAGAASAMAWQGGMVALAHTALAATATTFDFQSISSAYRHLMIVGYLRCTDNSPTASITCTVNNDSGSNYDRQGLRGNNVTASALNTTGGTPQIIAAVPAASADGAANAAGVVQIFIPRYAGTTLNKVLIASGGAAMNIAGNGDIRQTVVAWRSTAAINRLTFGGGTFAIGSEMTVYGLGV